MKTLDDAHLIAENDSLLFRRKPLKNLLKEIGPEIKMVFVEGRRDDSLPSWIVFSFVHRQELGNYRCANGRSPRIIVFFKEYFDWSKARGDRENWAKADAERLGNLTVIHLKVYKDISKPPLTL